MFEPNRNISALLQLAAVIEAAPAAQFDMGESTLPGRPTDTSDDATGEACLSAGCIAGWAANIWPQFAAATVEVRNAQMEAFGLAAHPNMHWKFPQLCEHLGVSRDTGAALFFPDGFDFGYGRFGEAIEYDGAIDRARAAQELRRLAFEGEVTWADRPSPFWLLRQCDGLSATNEAVPMWLLSKSTSTAGEANIYWLSQGSPVGPFSTEREAILDFQGSLN